MWVKKSIIPPMIGNGNHTSLPAIKMVMTGGW